MCDALAPIWSVNLSIHIIWMSPFLALGWKAGEDLVWGMVEVVSLFIFTEFYIFSIENSASKKCRPSSDAAFCGVGTGSALFA